MLGSLALGLKSWPKEIEMEKEFRRFVKTGDDYLWRGKYYTHYFTFEEIKKFFSKNFKIIKIIGLEGLATPNPDGLNKLAKNKKAFKNWLWMHYKLCDNPFVAANSVHILIIGKKK